MEKQDVKFAVAHVDGVIYRIGITQALVPEIQFKGGTTLWFDDSKLLKTNRTGKSVRGYEVVNK